MREGWVRRCRNTAAFLALALAFSAGGAVAQSAAAPAKSARSKPTAGARSLECAAITFRGVTTLTVPDGVQEAGLYKSPLGRIGLEARIKARRPVDYWLTLDNHGLPPVDTPLPAALEPCLKAKGGPVHLAQQRTPCIGNRFKIVLTRAGIDAPQYLLLYSLTGSGGTAARAWRFCRAAVIPRNAAP